jgi:hypothetical protein
MDSPEANELSETAGQAEGFSPPQAPPGAILPEELPGPLADLPINQRPGWLAGVDARSGEGHPLSLFRA